MNVDQQKMWSTISDAPASYYVSASEDERQAMREWTTGVMREREILIEFEKSDGTSREMRCTLQESVVPKNTQENDTKRKYNPDVCVVWDLALNQWRSFRWDRLRKIQFTLG